MLSYYVIYYEKLRKIMQRKEKKALKNNFKDHTIIKAPMWWNVRLKEVMVTPLDQLVKHVNAKDRV